MTAASTEPPLLQFARWLFAQGFQPMRLPKGRKSAPPSEWQHTQHVNADALAAYFAGHDGNLAYTFPPTHAAIDLDRKNGRDGVAELDKLCKRLGVAMPPTLTARTPNNGLHLIVKLPPGIVLKNHTGGDDDVFPGIDVKSFGGYVVSEPSVIPEGAYAFDRSVTAIAELPMALARAFVDRERTAKQKVVAEVEERRTAGGQERRIAESGRNTTLASMAGSMRHVGLGVEAIRVALQVANEQQCDPPLDRLEVDKIAASIGKYSPAPGPEFGRGAIPADAELRAPPPPAAGPLDILAELVAPPLRLDDLPPIVATHARLQGAARGHDSGAIAVSMLGATCGMLSDEVMVEVDRRTKWRESARLWVLQIGGAGRAKTPAIRLATAPIIAEHMALRQRWQDACKLLGKDEPKPPAPTVYTSDSTIEALAENLSHTNRGLFSIYEELDSWIGSHDAYRDGQGSKDRGDWLKLYDGGHHSVDRVKRGTFNVVNFGCSILAATTPSALQRHAKNLPPDGLIQRFNVYMVMAGGTPDEDISEDELARARNAYEQRLKVMFAYSKGDRDVQMSPQAHEIFNARRASLKAEILALEGVNVPFAGHIAKHAAMVARLALVFHALETTEHPAETPISGDTMRRAVAVMAQLGLHAATMYQTLGGAGGDVLSLARECARSILADSLASVTRNDLMQHSKRFRVADERAKDGAIRLLEDCGWLMADPAARLISGRTSRFLVVKEVHSIFSAHGEAHRQRRKFVKAAIAGSEE